MAKIALLASERKPHAAARAQIFPSWALHRQLPAWLDALDPPARERIGRALDDRTVRLVLGDDGRVFVARAGRP
jgi:hypothetical protein